MGGGNSKCPYKNPNRCRLQPYASLRLSGLEEPTTLKIKLPPNNSKEIRKLTRRIKKARKAGKQALVERLRAKRRKAIKEHTTYIATPHV